MSNMGIKKTNMKLIYGKIDSDFYEISESFNKIKRKALNPKTIIIL